MASAVNKENKQQIMLGDTNEDCITTEKAGKGLVAELDPVYRPFSFLGRHLSDLSLFVFGKKWCPTTNVEALKSLVYQYSAKIAKLPKEDYDRKGRLVYEFGQELARIK